MMKKGTFWGISFGIAAAGSLWAAPGALRLSEQGQISQWQTGDHVVIHTTSKNSPLLMRISGTDHSLVVSRQEDTASGKIVEGKIANVKAQISYSVGEDAERVEIEIRLQGDPQQVEALRWQLPLSLNPRKRVWMRGDYDMEWDTRYFYQFNVGAKQQLLTEPDRNEWRWFGMDRFSSNSFRLWKAESSSTSPLMMQEGRKAAPAIEVYDRQRGVLMELREGESPLPTRLEVDASGGASLAVDLLPGSVRPVERRSLFAEPLRIVLYAVEGEAMRKNLREMIAKRYPASPRPLPEEAMEESRWLRETAAPKRPRYVTGGYPFAPGALQRDRSLSINGKATQMKPIAFWPDQSVKHALLTFPLPEEVAREKGTMPVVTLRDRPSLPISLEISEANHSAKKMLTVTENQEGVTIANGEMIATLSKGSRWLASLKWQGHELLRAEEKARLAYSDFQIQPESVGFYLRTAEGGEKDAGTLEVTELQVEESGPLRAVVRLAGMTTNREPVRMIVRLEFYAGSPEIRMTHSAVFRFKDPRQTFLTGMGFELPLASKPSAVSLPQGYLKEHRTWESLTLLQRTPFLQQLEQKATNGQWTREEADAETPGWVQFRSEVPMMAAIRNFRETAPKAITLDHTNGVLRYELWPLEAGPMDVRRYSDYPHLAQGESVRSRTNWVKDDFYPKDPFVGVSRTHEVLLSLATSAEEAQPVAADFQSPPLLYAGWQAYEKAKVVLPHGAQEEWPRTWANWTRLTNFLLWHRELYGWYGFWNFGDVRHFFRNGYGWISSPALVRNERPWEHDDRKARRLPRGSFTKDYTTQNDWAYDNGRWGWSNTEGLPGLFLQHEYLRHGNRVVYFAAEAAGRHSRDVVTRHEGLWYGLGTRHGVQHWSCGDHEERQTTVSEYRHHYFLSGDARSREVAGNLYRDIYSRTPVFIHASHSGRLQGLLFHWELTGDAQEGERLRAYVDTFIIPEGITISPNVAFPDPALRGKPRHINGGSMFFHTFGGLHALVEYHQITGYAPLAEALVRMTDHFLTQPSVQEVLQGKRTTSADIFWPALAFSAKHSNQPKRYRTALRQYIQNGASSLLYQTVTEDSKHWTGPTAILRGNIPLALFWNNWSPYMTHSLGEKEVWDEKTAAAHAEGEKGADRVFPRESWQDQFDHQPDLEGYFSRQFPFETKGNQP